MDGLECMQGLPLHLVEVILELSDLSIDTRLELHIRPKKLVPPEGLRTQLVVMHRRRIAFAAAAKQQKEPPDDDEEQIVVLDAVHVGGDRRRQLFIDMTEYGENDLLSENYRMHMWFLMDGEARFTIAHTSVLVFL